MGLKEAVEALRRGDPVLIYDGDERESEVDLVYHASKADADAIYTLRTVAGGLICYVTLSEVTRELGIPWGDELLSLIPSLKPLTEKRLSYGDRTAFTIWVNHANSKTGIRDSDRSLTVRRLDHVTRLVLEGRVEEAKRVFYSEFQAPGHVPILASRGLDERRGHTELSTSLALLAGLRPSLVLAEMLDRGDALSLEKARRIGEEHGWPLVEGWEIVEVCRSEEVCRSGRHNILKSRHG